MGIDLRNGNKGYELNLGWKAREYPADGWWDHANEIEVIQHRFYLGSKKDAAEVAALRLEQFWKQVKDNQHVAFANLEMDFGTSKLYGKPPRPLWSPLTLEMAKAIAKGATSFEVPRLHAKQENLEYVKYLANLRRAFPVIQLVAEEEEAFAKGQAVAQRIVENSLAVARMMDRDAGTGQTLHQAFADYITKFKNEEREGDSGWPRTQARQAERLKGAHKDCVLSSIRLGEMQAMFDYWRFRPKAKTTGKPIAKNTADNQIWQLGNFFDWLHKEPKYDWRRPADCWLDIDRTVNLTTAEKAEKHQTLHVATYSVDELTILYRYASPLMRSMILLALNCGFKQAELGTLRTTETFLKEAHPYAKELEIDADKNASYIKRVRIKSGVYGEWELWPETVQAIEWAMERRKEAKTNTPFVLVSSKGRGYAEKTEGGNKPSMVRNYWENLLDTVQAQPEHEKFRRLPFSMLRKTANDMIRKIAGGEVSGLFLCHGKPVKTDDLADIYANRPFGKVFKALRLVRKKLQPMFADPSQVVLT